VIVFHELWILPYDRISVFKMNIKIRVSSKSIKFSKKTVIEGLRIL